MNLKQTEGIELETLALVSSYYNHSAIFPYNFQKC